MRTIVDVMTGQVTVDPDWTQEPIPPTIEDYKTAVQAHLGAAAQSKLYTDGNSLATYTASTNPQWASPPDPVPTPADVVAGLPVIEWPEVGE